MSQPVLTCQGNGGAACTNHLAGGQDALVALLHDGGSGEGHHGGVGLGAVQAEHGGGLRVQVSQEQRNEHINGWCISLHVLKKHPVFRPGNAAIQLHL
jgi:hypothetical protein